MRLIVCGSRTFEYRQLVFDFLDGVYRGSTMGYLTADMWGFTIIEGGAKGADTLAREWVEAKTFPQEPYPEDRNDVAAYPDTPPFEHMHMPADWRAQPRRAGYLRNRLMLVKLMEGPPNEERMVLAFTDKPLADSAGTAMMVSLARMEKIPVAHIHFIGEWR